MQIRSTAILFSLVLFITSGAPLGAEDLWSSFQNGGELTKNPAILPQKWSPDENIAWKTSLAGYGQSTPVIDGDVIYVTSVVGPNKETNIVQALGLSDGKERWKYEGINATPEKNTTYVSRAAPTPVVDQNGIVAFFEGGNLVALDADGKVRWTRNLVQEYGPITARHGLSSSLEQNDEHVFVWVQRMENPYVLAIKKSDGENVWKSEGLISDDPITAWASPRLIPVDGNDQLVLSGSGKIAGYSPTTGERLWTFDNIAGNTTPTPIPLGKGRFLIGALGGRQSTGGTNPAESNGVIEIKKQDGKYAAKWKWQAKKATSSFGSPVAFDGRAYFVNRVGALFCLDLETGDEVFTGRIPSKSIWATPVATENHIYFFGKDGTTAIVERTDSLKVVAKNVLWEAGNIDRPQEGASAMGGPVLYAGSPANSSLILRRGDVLYAVKTP